MATVAAIDVGSNAIRLKIVQTTDTGRVVFSEVQRFAVRLGTDVFLKRKIGPATQKKLDAAFSVIAQRLHEKRVDKVLAVATSAMREAQNSRIIIGEIRKKFGLRLEVISGLRESALSRLALAGALNNNEKDVLFVDLGGGSLELQFRNKAKGRSLPLGTVRLLQRYPRLKNPLPPVVAEEIFQQVKGDIKTQIGRVGPCGIAVGTGGSFEVLAKLIASKVSHRSGIALERLSPLMLRLASLSRQRRIQDYGIRKDRADVIVPAVMVIRALAELYQLDELRVPGTGLRDALIYLALPPRVRGKYFAQVLGARGAKA